MTQTSVPADQKTPETTTPERKQNHFLGSLVSRALEEFCLNSDLVEEKREQRAIDLLTHVAADTDCVDQSVIFSENERVFCDLEDEAFTLEFFMGATPDDDFFAIYDYMGLPNPRPIRSLFDLGCALDETSILAAQVLHSFRNSMTGMVPSKIKEMAGQ
jgi:hypothetical protein